LPVPVCAVATTSRPSSAGGIAPACTGVGVTKFTAARRFCTRGERDSSENNFNSISYASPDTRRPCPQCVTCAAAQSGNFAQSQSRVVPVERSGAVRCSYLYVGEKRWGLLDTADRHSSASLRSCRTILASRKQLGFLRLHPLDTRWKATLLGWAKRFSCPHSTEPR
jgi:hypothetical protein